MGSFDRNLLSKFSREKYLKLVGCIIIDGIGYLSYLLPVFGEISDVIWAPISAISIFALFPKQKLFAVGGLVEELLPGADIVPTATIAWINWYIRHEKNAKNQYVDRYNSDLEIFKK